jgi:hypothetical protein
MNQVFHPSSRWRGQPKKKEPIYGKVEVKATVVFRDGFTIVEEFILLWAERGCFFCWMSDASRLAFSLPTFLFD